MHSRHASAARRLACAVAIVAPCSRAAAQGFCQSAYVNPLVPIDLGCTQATALAMHGSPNWDSQTQWHLASSATALASDAWGPTTTIDEVAMASANFLDGTLHAFASASGYTGWANAYAALGDVIGFDNPSQLGTYETLSFRVDGSTQGGGAGWLEVVVDAGTQWEQTKDVVVHGGEVFDFDLLCGPLFTSSSTCAHTFTASLQASAHDYGTGPGPNVADFSHTVQIGVRAAPGTTWWSGSGLLLADVPHTTTTPEPTTVALLGLGLAALGAAKVLGRGWGVATIPVTPGDAVSDDDRACVTHP